MKGKVNRYNEAIILLHIKGQGRLQRRVAAVVDTGFSGSLTLPRRIVRALKLPRVGTSKAQLADGRVVKFGTYVGFVEAEGRQHAVEIDEAESTPLLGMELMQDCRLSLEVWQGGAVALSRRRRKRP